LLYSVSRFGAELSCDFSLPRLLTFDLQTDKSFDNIKVRLTERVLRVSAATIGNDALLQPASTRRQCCAENESFKTAPIA
jgi:hypothetical protein